LPGLLPRTHDIHPRSSIVRFAQQRTTAFLGLPEVVDPASTVSTHIGLHVISILSMANTVFSFSCWLRFETL
jgi:hypothetical protein